MSQDNKLIPLEPQKRIRCTATSKRTGKQCGQWAILGKDKCKWHGGKTPIKTGLYAKYAPVLLAEKIEEAKNNPKLLDIREQIALQTSILNDFISKWEGMPLVLEARESMMTMSELVSKNIERLNRIESSDKLSVEAVQTVIRQIVEIVKLYVKDENTRKKISVAVAKVAAL